MLAGWWCLQLLLDQLQNNNVEFVVVVGGFLPNIKSLPTNVDVELGCDNNGVHSFHNVMLATPKGTAHTMFGE